MSDDLSQDLKVTEVDEPQDIMDQPTDAGIQSPKVDFPQLKDYFNIESPTDAQKVKFAEIWEYFGEESKTIGDLMYKMRQLENRLGSPAIGETRMQKMYNYIKISKNIKDDEKRRDALLRR